MFTLLRYILEIGKPMNNKRQLSKIILLLFLFILTNIFIITPIKERKQLLETEKYKIDQEIKEVERYKKQTEILKKEAKKKKVITVFGGKDDIIEIQNTIGRIVNIQSIENTVQLNEDGSRVSNISIKFVGTYQEIFKVVDALSSRGIEKNIKSFSISKISQSKIDSSEKNKSTIKNIEEIKNKPDTKEHKQETAQDNNRRETNKSPSTKFECILKISKI